MASIFERVGFDPGNRLSSLADAAYLIVDGHAEVILAHPKGAVYARRAEIPDHCRLDNAGIGAAARPKKRKMQ